MKIRWSYIGFTPDHLSEIPWTERLTGPQILSGVVRGVPIALDGRLSCQSRHATCPCAVYVFTDFHLWQFLFFENEEPFLGKCLDIRNANGADANVSNSLSPVACLPAIAGKAGIPTTWGGRDSEALLSRPALHSLAALRRPLRLMK